MMLALIIIVVRILPVNTTYDNICLFLYDPVCPFLSIHLYLEPLWKSVGSAPREDMIAEIEAFETFLLDGSIFIV
jgi:hypothetical protein